MTFLAHSDHISPATNNLHKHCSSLVGRIDKHIWGFTSVRRFISGYLNSLVIIHDPMLILKSKAMVMLPIVTNLHA
jgi:hypothetical protein